MRKMRIIAILTKSKADAMDRVQISLDANCICINPSKPVLVALRFSAEYNFLLRPLYSLSHICNWIRHISISVSPSQL